MPTVFGRFHCWDHERARASAFRARHVILAFGRGVPRRLDIPGNVRLLSLRFQDPERYLGQPACVVGVGTSAAEAVISISKAKAASGDETDVYWSYRGDKMPKVSKALAEVLFESYMGSGNIRYLPHSEPVSVLSDEDHPPRLCVRTDPGRAQPRLRLADRRESRPLCGGLRFAPSDASDVGAFRRDQC